MPSKLTPQLIKALTPPATGNRIEWDTQERGLGIRITAAGHRAWVLRYVVQGRERRLTLGDHPDLSLTAAREMARERKGEVIKGADPLARKQAAKDALTLGRVVELYVARHVTTTQKARTQIETRRALEMHWRPLHRLPLAMISRAEVAARLAELAAGSGPVAANRARAQLSALYRWAIGQGMAEINPVAGTIKPGAEAPRDRVLTAEELRAIWRACGDDDHGRIVRLLMLTGQRREEVAGMTWREVDRDGAVWRLPAQRTKNGKPHEVPLSDQALAVLSGVKPRHGRELLFGESDGPFSGWSRCKARLDERIARRAGAAGHDQPTAADEPAPWVLHDLRRTMVTGMAELGVQPHIIEAVVNHVSGHKAGVAGVYNRATYAREKREALALWGQHVATLVAGEPPRVVPIRRATA